MKRIEDLSEAKKSILAMLVVMGCLIFVVTISWYTIQVETDETLPKLRMCLAKGGKIDYIYEANISGIEIEDNFVCIFGNRVWIITPEDNYSDIYG